MDGALNGTFDLVLTAPNGSTWLLYVSDAETIILYQYWNDGPFAWIDVTPPDSNVSDDYPTGVGGGYQFTCHSEPTPHFSIQTGALPAGMSVTDDGVLLGSPVETGTFSFTVGVITPVTGLHTVECSFTIS